MSCSREHRERRERLGVDAADAGAIISWRRTVRDDVEAVATSARGMVEFLRESEMSERRAFVTTFVRQIAVTPGSALVRYTIAMPEDSTIPGRNTGQLELDGSVLSGRQ